MRLHIVVEGQTEETFVNDVLVPYLGHLRIATDARCVMTSRRGPHGMRGGAVSYHKVRFDLMQWIKQDTGRDVRFTTMLDLYALPNDFPGFTECHSIADPYDRIRSLELRFGEDICDNRFVPYIQLHEFEALLFSDIRQLELAFIDQLKGITRLGKLAERFSNPELINDRPQTAPSKRIIAEIPDYEHRKPSAGPLVAAKIGMDNMRAKCAHFRDWLTRLEDLSSAENV